MQTVYIGFHLPVQSRGDNDCISRLQKNGCRRSEIWSVFRWRDITFVRWNKHTEINKRNVLAYIGFHHFYVRQHKRYRQVLTRIQMYGTVCSHYVFEQNIALVDLCVFVSSNKCNISSSEDWPSLRSPTSIFIQHKHTNSSTNQGVAWHFVSFE
jgi:hypothetical protein